MAEAKTRKKKVKRNRQPFNLYLSPEEKEMLDHLSNKAGTSRNDILRMALRAFYEKQMGTTVKRK